MVKNYFKLIVALIFATNVMAQNIPSYVPTNGLVGWWPFNGNANDESGNGNHGTVNGATLTADRNGKVNSAYDFDGVDDNIISKRMYYKDFSVSLWTQINNLVQYTPFIDAYPEFWEFVSDSEGKYLDFVTWQIDGTYKDFITNYLIETKKWLHFSIVKKDKNLKIFVNGNLIKDVNNIIIKTVNNGNYLFGNSHSGSDQWLNGKLDDIAIYNRALSDQEVKQLYEGCTKETATSNSFNSYAFTNNSSINLSANPTGGTFTGEAVTNNAFNPSKAKLGKNQVKYTFKNSTGCADSTNFAMILVDTLGNKCSTYDTLKIKVKLTTGIKSGQVASMNVYPNPTSDVVVIEASDVAALNGYSYKMVDLQGKQVYKELVTKSKTEISLKSIGAKGVYILHVEDAQGVSIENKKIVLE